MQAARARNLTRWLLIAAALLSTPYLFAFGYVALNMGRDTAKPSDAVLVLGARAYLGGEINPCLAGRVRRGVELVRQGLAPRLIVSGGVDREDGAVEAEAMANLAVRLGLNPDRIVREPKATSTYENLRFAEEIMEANGWRSVVIVSQAFHLPRAALTARGLGLDFTLSPVQDDPCPASSLLRSRLREPLALLLYWLRGAS